MAKYRISASFDGKNFFWIVVDNGMLIRNPTEEDLKETKNNLKGKFPPIYYNETNVCPICRGEYERGEILELTDKSILYPGNVLCLTDKNGKKTDIVVCYNHGMRDYQRYNLNSMLNVHKALAGCRTGNLNPTSDTAKGNNFEILTDNILGTKRLSIKYDKYSKLPLDHSLIPNGLVIEFGGKLVDLSGKIIQTKGAYYSDKYRFWYQNFQDELGSIKKGFKFDYVVVYCASEDGKTIERIYFIPVKEIFDLEIKKKVRTCIGVYRNPNPVRGPFWYEQYRVTNEDSLKKVNEIWKQIINKERIS